MRLAPQDLVQRLTRLPERQVERRAVKRPAPVQPRDVCLRGHGEQVERVDQLAELTERVAPAEIVNGAGLLERDLVLGLVDDVLADALQAAALEVDDGREPLEPARDVQAQSLQRVAARPGAGGPRADRTSRSFGAARALEPRDQLLEPQLLEPG